MACRRCRHCNRDPAGRSSSSAAAARSIGLYAAGLAVAHGASVVDYLDDREARLDVAEGSVLAHTIGRTAGSRSWGRARPLRRRGGGVVECTGAARCATGPAPGRHLHRHRLLREHRHQDPGDGHVRHQRHAARRVSNVRPVLPALLDFVATTGFPAERVTSLARGLGRRSDAYQSHTTKVVLHRDPLDLSHRQQHRRRIRCRRSSSPCPRVPSPSTGASPSRTTCRRPAPVGGGAPDNEFFRSLAWAYLHQLPRAARSPRLMRSRGSASMSPCRPVPSTTSAALGWSKEATEVVLAAAGLGADQALRCGC